MNAKSFERNSEAQRAAASKGGKRAHELGVAHKFKAGSELAREAGRKGGAVHRAKREAIREAERVAEAQRVAERFRQTPLSETEAQDKPSAAE